MSNEVARMGVVRLKTFIRCLPGWGEAKASDLYAIGSLESSSMCTYRVYTSRSTTLNP